MTAPSEEVTQLLVAWSSGDQRALDKLMPLIYAELRQMARRHMKRQREGHTLQTTALINEAFLKLVNQPEKHWQNRAHFFGVASQAMRQVLVDYARSRRYAKRGGGERPVSLDEAAVITEERAAELVELDDALKALARVDLRKSQIVEMRYFGGLSDAEIAAALDLTTRTVQRDWEKARMLLRSMLNQAR